MIQDVLWKPQFLDVHQPSDYDRWKTIRRSKHAHIRDDVNGQIRELYAIRHPQSIHAGIRDEEVQKFALGLFSGDTARRFGSWVWYPWSLTLVHVLPEPLYTELRTARNRNLITQKEQERYYHSTVGVAGLSVGNAVVSTILHTGGAKTLRIADNDILSGSNMNRIKAGLDSIGLSKTVICCREIYTVNPYADLTVYEEGITMKNLAAFLTKPAPLSVVVDEMDNLYLKIQLRMLARAHKIPVVMAADNGDGIVVDIERFDLDPKRPLLHGDIPERDLMAIKPDISRVEAARIISRWVGPSYIAERMKSSLREIGSTLYTWPQLGNAAFLAGAVMAYVVRRIVLRDSVRQGKIVVSPDEWFVPGYQSVRSRGLRQKKTREFMKFIAAAG